MSPSVLRVLINAFKIIVIDLNLAGDNALVIALAVRSLPPAQRKLGSLIGALAAVALRVALTFVAVQLLDVEFIKLAGGAFVLWIAVKVFGDAEPSESQTGKSRQMWQAVWYIVFADITMSTDNILAIAGASEGNLPLIVFGLGVSIPFIVFSSNLLVKLLHRFPWMLYLGAAILGEVGAEMILTDNFIVRTLHPSNAAGWIAKVVAIGGVLLASWLRAKPGRESAKHQPD